jgi:hypothetical protein
MSFDLVDSHYYSPPGNLHKALRTKQLSMKNKVSIALDIAKALVSTETLYLAARYFFRSRSGIIGS